jgi:hypothetical protein
MSVPYCPRQRRTEQTPDRNLHLRDLPSVRFKESKIPRPFREFVSDRLLDRIPFTGYKIPRKTEIAVQILNNLVLTGLCDYAVGDSRDYRQYEVRLRVPIWDRMRELGWAEVCLGSEMSGMRTRYAATPRLLRLFRGWHISAIQDFNLERNTELAIPTDHALVVLRRGKKDPETGKRLSKSQQREPLPLPEDPSGVLRRLCDFQNHVEFVNQFNVKFAWVEVGTSAITGRPIVRPVSPILRMIYRGHLWNGGRLYTWGPASGQGLPPNRRQNIRINEEPVAEFDFSAHALRMLYHRYANIDPDPSRDLYRTELILPRFYRSRHATSEAREVARAFVKRVTNTMLNVSHPVRAQKSAEKAFEGWEDFDLLKRILRIERITPAQVVDRVWQKHPEVNSFFYTKIGRKLMQLECRLMLKILVRLAKAGKPVLGIHDALLVRRSDAHSALRAMTDEYRHFAGFRPVIKRKF